MPWQGVWFDPQAFDGKSRSPEWFRGLAAPRAYPYPRNFIEEEANRLETSPDPGMIVRDGGRHQVFYALVHDGGSTQLDGQGCRILNWLFHNFSTASGERISRRFSEIPIVIHETNAPQAAALGNALTLLRFLDAEEDQAIAKIFLLPWTPLRAGAQYTALDFEERLLQYLGGELFYPEDVTLFDVLERNDLKAHRALGPCCESQMGFIRSILEWIDDCWPSSAAAAERLRQEIRRSLADEAGIWRRAGRMPESRCR